MLKKVKEFFRKIVSNIAEKIYWENYVEKVLQGEFWEVEVDDPSIIRKIIQWAHCKEPMSRFIETLKMIGINPKIYLNKSRQENNDRILTYEEKTQNEWIIYFDNNRELYISSNKYNIEFRRYGNFGENCFHCKTISDIKNYETTIKYDNNSIEIKISSNNNEDFIICFNVRKAMKKQSKDTFMEQDKEIRKTLEHICVIACKETFYTLYRTMKEMILNFYDLDDAQIGMEIEIVKQKSYTKLATKNGKLLDYKDEFLEIKNYEAWKSKEYQKDGITVKFENDQIKISGLSDTKKTQEYIIEAEKEIHKIEKLKF